MTAREAIDAANDAEPGERYAATRRSAGRADRAAPCERDAGRLFPRLGTELLETFSFDRWQPSQRKTRQPLWEKLRVRT